MLAKISVGAVILVLRVKQKVKSFVVLSYLREEKRRNNRHTNVSTFQYLSGFLHATLSQHFLLTSVPVYTYLVLHTNYTHYMGSDPPH